MTVTLKIPGTRITPSGSGAPLLPALFAPGTRSASGADDVFLPRDYLKVVEVIDVASASRAPGALPEAELTLPDDRIVVLEMEGGLNVVTSAARLAATLERLERETPQAPDANAARGSVIAPADVPAPGPPSLGVLARRGAATRSISGDLGKLVSRVITLDLDRAGDAIVQQAKELALEWAQELGGDTLARVAEGGVSWLGTKALMWAIESRLGREAGLHRFRGAAGKTVALEPLDRATLAADAARGPLLVFIHGTASSTAGSFSDLVLGESEPFRALEQKFADRIYAFEHRTLSKSPIENAIELLELLPEKSRVSLVTHSRGGLVGDLLCLRDFEALIPDYGTTLLGLAPDSEAGRDERPEIYAEQRKQLLALAELVRKKDVTIERYVRVACPARGTSLASANLDAFLSALLSLIGLVPGLAGSPLYAAFKRVVLEVVKNRTRPELVPGIEAMLPESPLAGLLSRAEPQRELAMSVIAGDIEADSLFKRLGVFFTDFIIFRRAQNDLIVDTSSMYAGVAERGNARALFEQGPDVNHFRYFSNDSSRRALVEWLTQANLTTLDTFGPLPASAREPTRREIEERRSRALRRDARGAPRPVVVVLPGIMGSHLWVERRDRIWFDPVDLAWGGLEKLKWGTAGVEAEALFELFYGGLSDFLEDRGHEVVRFPYDWRQPLNVLADRFAAELAPLLARTREAKTPVRLLAHSMGGLVVRALVHQHPALFEELMSRDGARFVMLGTPNQGSHAMVETLIGKSSEIRMLARADLKKGLQQLLDLVAEFRGALQLLPKPGFQDSARSQLEYFEKQAWSELKRGLADFWFGDGICAVPNEQVLEEARWLWNMDQAALDAGRPLLPAKFSQKTCYVYGSAPETPAGIKKLDGKWKMLATTRGDGTVSWDSGTLANIDGHYFMPAKHGALASTKRYFGALGELLTHGATTGLPQSPPTPRDALPAESVIAYDAGPPVFPTRADVAGGFFGHGGGTSTPERELRSLKIRVRAADMRWVDQAILVGHYAEDPISGAEAVIDREILNGQLTVRKSLGLYAGQVGTATVVLIQNDLEKRRRTTRGAIVTGLGKYDGSLSPTTLREAVRAGALRYLVHVQDTRAELARDGNRLPLTSVLLGYNSSTSISIADSVAALVRGVVEANQKFSETSRLLGGPSGSDSSLYIGSLDIVEKYLDTAVSAAHALVEVARMLNEDPNLGCRVEVEPRLVEGEGAVHRLDDVRGGSYWPRLIISDADRDEDECPPECFDLGCPPECLEEPCDCEGAASEDEGKAPGAPKPPPKNVPRWLERRLAPADRLKFLYLGARARAESVKLQRQPGLIERLVETQITRDAYDEDFSRTLFQLLVPNDFKDAARQMKQIVLVLDRYTADLPWELMLADNKPLAIQTAVIRQLKSTRSRVQVRQASGKHAYVVGNPSSAGFGTTFPGFGDPRDGRISNLPGAEAEANAVARALFSHGFNVTSAIGNQQTAVNVLANLYKAPYRILHIAAHGVFQLEGKDGKARSGVVLSDGLLITAAEIQAMEITPDLVFLNSCHLGRVEGTAFNRLAHSVSRELIDIGVRAVVVAGWPVNDDAALAFATAFYERLLGGQSFGQALYDARRFTYERFPHTSTWAAYQAYCGDPAWVLQHGGNARTEPAAPAEPRSYVASDELVADLERLRQSLFFRRGIVSKNESKLVEDSVATMLRRADGLDAVIDGEYRARPDVCTALGNLFYELGPDYFDKARSYYARAVSRATERAPVPIRAIESLANVEARLGATTGDTGLIEQAIERLRVLERLTQPAAAPSDGEVVQVGRRSLLASAYKRLATVRARVFVESNGDADLAAVRDAIERSQEHYAESALAQTDDPPRLYPGLNWLFLELLRARDEARAERFTAWSQKLIQEAEQAYEQAPSFWSSVIGAEVLLLQALAKEPRAPEQRAREGDSVAEPAPAVAAALDEITKRYCEARESTGVSPKEFDSALDQIRTLQEVYRAEALALRIGSSSVANHLHELLNRLTPPA